MGTLVRPAVATWTGPGPEPVTRRTVSLGDPPTVQTWRLVGYVDPAGEWRDLDDPEAHAGLFAGLWVLHDEEPIKCGCGHTSDEHEALGRGRCPRGGCGCRAFHMPQGGVR
jgi:hypothetical protein